MAKVKESKIKKDERSTQLPLDDPRWRPIDEIAKQFFPHTHFNLIALDLTKVAANEKMRCMRRYTSEHPLRLSSLNDDELLAVRDGKVVAGDESLDHRELLPSSFWVEHFFACSPDGKICVGRRLPPGADGISKLSFTFMADWASFFGYRTA